MHTTTPRLPASEAYKLQPLRFARGCPPHESEHIAAPARARTPAANHKIAGHRLIGVATA